MLIGSTEYFTCIMGEEVAFSSQSFLLKSDQNCWETSVVFFNDGLKIKVTFYDESDNALKSEELISCPHIVQGGISTLFRAVIPAGATRFKVAAMPIDTDPNLKCIALHSYVVLKDEPSCSYSPVCTGRITSSNETVYMYIEWNLIWLMCKTIIHTNLYLQ